MEGKVSKLDHEKEKEIDEFVNRWMIEDEIPGFSLSIVDNKEMKYAKGFGSRDLKANLPATYRTMYGIGSCTKSFTALAIMKLVEDDRLNLDDNINDYIKIDLGLGNKPITVHNLLTHSSGIPSLGVSEVLIARLIDLEERGVPLASTDDFYRHLELAKDEIADEPGERFFYFNSGYNLLGKIIENVTERPFSKFIRKNILERLDMNRSGFLDGDDDSMTPYFSREEGVTPTELPQREIGYPAGGLLSSVDELSHYLLMNMSGGMFGEEQIISEDNLNEMIKGHIEREHGEYGYGWSIKEFLGKRLIGHGGSIAVSAAYLGFTDNFGVALACNTSPSYSLEEVGKGIIAILEGEDWRELLFFSRKEKLERLTGEYEAYRGVKRAKIRIEAGLLKLDFIEKLEKQSVILIPKSKTIDDYEFYYLDGSGERNTVEFDVNENGIDLYIGRYRLHKI